MKKLRLLVASDKREVAGRLAGWLQAVPNIEVDPVYAHNHDVVIEALGKRPHIIVAHMYMSGKSALMQHVVGYLQKEDLTARTPLICVASEKVISEYRNFLIEKVGARKCAFLGDDSRDAIVVAVREFAQSIR